MRVLQGFVAAAASAAVITITVLPVEPAGADQVRDDQWHLDALNIEEAHEISQGEGVTVAVLDSGVDADHPDLSGNVLPGIDITKEAAENGWRDTDGHGTAMAGLIAAHGHGTGGGSGALGIAPKAKILPIRNLLKNESLFDPNWDVTDPKNVDAIDEGDAVRYAIEHGAKIISISEYITIEGSALKEAREKGVLIFAASGNLSQGDRGVISPANYNWVAAVGGSDQSGNYWDGAVGGPEVELAAPGPKVTSTAPGGGYRTGSGTSDSTAIASGVAALIWSKFPDLTAEEVLYRMEATAVDKGSPGRDEQTGFGVIDPVAALTEDLPPLPPVDTSPTPTTTTTTPQNKAGDGAAPAVTGGDDDGGGSSPFVVVAAVAGIAALVTALVVVSNRKSAGEQASKSKAPLAVVGVLVVVALGAGGFALADSGDDGGGGGGGGFDGPYPETPEDLVHTYLDAVKAKDCGAALDLMTQTSRSAYGSLDDKAAEAKCQTDASGLLGGGTSIADLKTEWEGSKDAGVQVNLAMADGKQQQIVIGLAKTDGKWQVDLYPPEGYENVGFLVVTTTSSTTPPITVDTNVYIAKENNTPPSCLKAKTAADFAQCYGDMARYMFYG